MKRLAFALFLIFAYASPVAAGWDEAKAAFDRGDYETAAREYRVLAERGDAWAQNNLGIMYYYGQGVPQDSVQAHLWLSLAASRLSPGEQRDVAVYGRDLVARQMTPAKLAEAERLAQKWKPKKQ